jgi:hypothetical protein
MLSLRWWVGCFVVVVAVGCGGGGVNPQNKATSTEEITEFLAENRDYSNDQPKGKASKAPLDLGN